MANLSDQMAQCAGHTSLVDSRGIVNLHGHNCPFVQIPGSVNRQPVHIVRMYSTLVWKKEFVISSLPNILPMAQSWSISLMCGKGKLSGTMLTFNMWNSLTHRGNTVGSGFGMMKDGDLCASMVTVNQDQYVVVEALSRLLNTSWSSRMHIFECAPKHPWTAHGKERHPVGSQNEECQQGTYL